MLRALQKAMAPALRRIALMVGRSVLELVDDTPPVQVVQLSLLDDEVRANVERVQEYGFTSHPHPGADAVAVAVAGSRDNLVVVAVDDRRYRLRALQAGEVAIYTDEGDKIVLKRGGTIEVTAATKVLITAPLVQCTGNLQVDGNLVVNGTGAVAGNLDGGANITAAGSVADQGGAKSMAGMRTAYNAHKHGTSPLTDHGM